VTRFTSANFAQRHFQLNRHEIITRGGSSMEEIMSDTALASKFNKPTEKIRDAMSALNIGSLLGTWVNVNSATRDIVKVVLTNNGGALGVHAYGACSPTPCDWGEVTGQAYAASVSGGKAVAFTANYAFGFKDTILTGHLDHDHLIVDDFNVFEDGSGRSAYFTEGTFKKT
jgi:hypothetical protein